MNLHDEKRVVGLALEKLGEFVSEIAQGDYDLDDPMVRATVVQIGERIRVLNEALEMRARFERREGSKQICNLSKSLHS